MPHIQFGASGARIDVPRGTRLIDAIRRAGLPIARPCGDELICGKCGVRILAGDPGREAEVERRAKARNRVDPDLRLACALRVRDDLVIMADYWGTTAPRRALILIDHGSRQPEAHAHLVWLAEQVRGRAPQLFVAVAHMELCEPSLEQALASCAREGIRDVAVHPLFLVPGRHLVRDVPEQVERAAARHPELSVRILPALGTRAELADAILATLEPSD